MAAAKKPIIVALIANSSIAVAKFFAAFATGSAAMLAEAYHSLSDTLNQIFLLIGLKRSVKPADAAHPFGYGMSSYFWSFVVAVMLFGVAGTLSLVEGVESLQHPHAVSWDDARWALGVLLFAFLFEGYALWVTIKELQKAQKRMKAKTLRGAIKRTKDASLLTILFEDSLALAGIVVAGGGIGLALATGDGRFDAAASVVIGLMLMGFALVLANRNRRLLLGEAMDPAEQTRMIEAASSVAAVTKVLAVRSMHLAPSNVLVAMDIHFRDSLDTDQVEAAIDEVQAAVQAACPDVKTCMVEAQGAE